MTLSEKIGTEIIKTQSKKKLTLRGKTIDYDVYRIPLELLYYNDKNGRIATWISKHIEEHGDLDKNDVEEYNNVLQKYIRDSNPTALDSTRKNIKNFGQRHAGVVLEDGRIIDGNRRFTCLREIYQIDGQKIDFEAVILNPEDGLTEKDIKRLELNLQLGEEKPVDYDPIDTLVDIYRDLVLNNYFSVEEYAHETNNTPATINQQLGKAKLMIDFLKFINADHKYHIAKEYKLDGPLQEIEGILTRKNTPDEFKEEIKHALFTAIITSNAGALTPRIREVGKEIIKAGKTEEFIEEYEDIIYDVHEKLQESSHDNITSISKAITEIKEVKEEGERIIDEMIEDSKEDQAKQVPLKLLEKAHKDISKIDSLEISYMDQKDLFAEKLTEIETLISELQNEVKRYV